MKETKIRALVRNQIIKELDEQPDLRGIRGISKAKSGLQRSLGKIDTGAIAKLNKSQKIRLLTSLLSNVGITAQDFETIKNQVGRKLADTIAPADESIQEQEDDFEMSKTATGFPKSKIGNNSEINKASEVFKNIRSLSDTDRPKAIAYILNNAGFDLPSFQKSFQRIKTNLKKYNK